MACQADFCGIGCTLKRVYVQKMGLISGFFNAPQKESINWNERFRSCNAKDFGRCKKVAYQADFLGIGCTLKRVYVQKMGLISGFFMHPKKRV